MTASAIACYQLRGRGCFQGVHVRAFMVAFHQHGMEGKAATPASLKQSTKTMKRHRDVTDISFSWIAKIMEGIVREMKDEAGGG